MIKLKDILFEQSNDAKAFTYNFEFESGKTNLTPTGQAELNKVIGQVKKLLSQNYKKETMKINVNAQESKVTNQPPYEVEGSLAKARSEMLSKELKRAFPDIEINASYVPKAQGPEWNPPAESTPEQRRALARDEKYKQHQRVTAKIMLDPAGEERPIPLHRIALAFSGTEVGLFCMENLKNYEATPVNEILGYVDKNIEKLSTSESNDELQYLDSYQWMKGNLTASMRSSYSTAIYGAVIYPNNPRSKPLVDLLKKYGATQSRINPKTKIRLEDTTAEHVWFIYDERQIVNFFQQVSRDELKQIVKQTRK